MKPNSIFYPATIIKIKLLFLENNVFLVLFSRSYRN